MVMAVTTASPCSSLHLLHLSASTATLPNPNTHHHHQIRASQFTSTSSNPSFCSIRQRRSFKSFSLKNGDMLGDFGARDPFPAEIESGFGDKVGNYNTEHKILIPNTANISSLSLAHQNCSSPPLPLSNEDARSLLRKVVGWRLVDVDEKGGIKLQCVWKLRDFKCGVELINRIHSVVEVAGHYPNLHLEQNPNQVRAELWSASIGGLSMNDFIVAAKIDEIKTSDLVPKKRFWA